MSSRISGLDIDSDIARRAIGSYLHDYYSAVEKLRPMFVERPEKVCPWVMIGITN